jgi:hypothetical protein
MTDIAVKKYFENLGYSVTWIAETQTIRVFHPEYGCYTDFLPIDYVLKNGVSFADHREIGAREAELIECGNVLTDFPGSPVIGVPPGVIPGAYLAPDGNTDINPHFELKAIHQVIEKLIEDMKLKF